MLRVIKSAVNQVVLTSVPGLALVLKVKIPDAPGWGVKINPAWIEKAAYQKSERLAKS